MSWDATDLVSKEEAAKGGGVSSSFPSSSSSSAVDTSAFFSNLGSLTNFPKMKVDFRLGIMLVHMATSDPIVGLSHMEAPM